VVLGRKFCSGCGRWRPVSDFHLQSERPPLRANGLGRPPSASGLRSRCQACSNAAQRQRRAVRTPEQRRIDAEYYRFYSEVHRRLAGKPVRVRKTSVVDHPERILLDPAPLLAELEHYIRQLGDNYSANGHPKTWGELAERAGISQRAIYRLRHGESQHVRIDIADKLAVAIGVPLAVIYPA
jgi:hypothetical protein